MEMLSPQRLQQVHSCPRGAWHLSGRPGLCHSCHRPSPRTICAHRHPSSLRQVCTPGLPPGPGTGTPDPKDPAHPNVRGSGNSFQAVLRSMPAPPTRGMPREGSHTGHRPRGLVWGPAHLPQHTEHTADPGGGDRDGEAPEPKPPAGPRKTRRSTHGAPAACSGRPGDLSEKTGQTHTQQARGWFQGPRAHDLLSPWSAASSALFPRGRGQCDSQSNQQRSGPRRAGEQQCA